MVKKGVMIIVVMIILCLSVSFASNDAIAIYINNSKIEFADVLPFIDENNRTLIPVRFISESLDASVKWISDTRTVKILKNDTIIELEIDSNIAKVNGKSIIMDTKAVIINNRTIVPLRFISEVLDFDINYKFDYDDRDDNIKRHIVDIYNLELKLATELRNMNNQDIDVSEYNLKISDMNNLNEKMID
ncbi:MAG: copper amine oxidase N-terminal domain-containing protein, partial [Bacillota bacterium]|nr:copper amine oxidase N-terminal domain-containing protein [Bacillota bacterium]